MDVSGLHGKGSIDTVGHFPGFGEAIYAPDSGTNGLALCEVESRYEVKYVQRVHFLVTVNDNLTLDFCYDDTVGAYACVFDDAVIKALKDQDSRFPYHCLIATISEAEKAYSSRELKRAQLARSMMRRTYYASDTAFVRTVTKGALLECPVTGKDIRMAIDIYGKDVASLQGKLKTKVRSRTTESLCLQWNKKNK